MEMLHTLFLASESPRRASLVRLLGVKRISIHPANLHEVMDAALTPSENVVRLAQHKARKVAEELADAPSPNPSRKRDGNYNGVVLGADTTVWIGGKMLEKPIDEQDAERMLLQLSGATHTVYTGVALYDIESKRELSFVEATDVTFRVLSINEIRDYIATGSPMDKAGAYGIQEDFGAVFVQRIDGDYYNVVGLPLCSLYVALKSFAPKLWE
jgi:septum formation protein